MLGAIQRGPRCRHSSPYRSPRPCRRTFRRSCEKLRWPRIRWASPTSCSSSSRGRPLTAVVGASPAPSPSATAPACRGPRARRRALPDLFGRVHRHEPPCRRGGSVLHLHRPRHRQAGRRRRRDDGARHLQRGADRGLCAVRRVRLRRARALRPRVALVGVGVRGARRRPPVRPAQHRLQRHHPRVCMVAEIAILLLLESRAFS